MVLVRQDGYMIGTDVLFVKCVTCRSAATPAVMFGLYFLVHDQQDAAAGLQMRCALLTAAHWSRIL